VKTVGKFPFGHPVRVLVQKDRTPKRVFVLGVYASAVHARWVGNDGKEIVKALAIASEPEIFWRGEGSAEIVQAVSIPSEAGRLEVAGRQYNGPSGVALDEFFLAPLGLTRDEAWLCDLVPHSCMNSGQKKAVERAYQPLVRQYGLPEVSVPEVPNSFADEKRCEAILDEMQESQAETLIFLGDQPIRWFLHFYVPHWQRLSDFGSDMESYGRMHQIRIAGRRKWVLPVAHPRQVARLGRSSEKWYRFHQTWLEERASGLLGSSGAA
jgi:uracil-DNA glycosylase